VKLLVKYCTSHDVCHFYNQKVASNQYVCSLSDVAYAYDVASSSSLLALSEIVAGA